MAQAPEAPPPGSISGTVRDAVSGAPIRDAQVSVNRITATTDAEGRYTLRDVPPGEQRVGAFTASQGQMGFGPSESRMVLVVSGQEATSIDFRLREFGQISGKVVDDNKEPVPDVLVFQAAREYRLGALRYVFRGAARTDDQGAYTLPRVEPGRPIILLTERRDLKVDAVSDDPADPKLRRRSFVPTFYPDAASPEGAQLMTLRPGEQRQGIDFRLRRAPNYCMDGTLNGNNGPAALSFSIEESQPTSGRSGQMGFYMASPGGRAGPDGKIRLCGLHPGEYRVTAYEPVSGMDAAPGFFGVSTIMVTDRDLHDVRIPALARIPVAGETAWAGDAPGKPPEVKLSLYLDSVTRAPFGGERAGMSAEVGVPGDFSFPGLLADDYELNVRGLPRGWYIDDITYGGNSVLNRPFRPGSGLGNLGLRVRIARDGGFIRAEVADEDNKPVGNAAITIFPDFSGSDADLAALIVRGQTNQSGGYSSGTLAPGKYYVVATSVPTDNTPESVAKVRMAKTRAAEVEVRNGATARASLKPLNLD